MTWVGEGERMCGEICHNGKPSRGRADAEAEIVRSKIHRGGDGGRVKNDLGGTCHNDKSGRVYEEIETDGVMEMKE